MTEQSTRVQVRILDKEFQVACPAEEKEALLFAAHELDRRMRHVRNSGSMIGTDRIAVMVALNLCHELHECQKRSAHTSGDADENHQRLIDKLNKALLD